MTYQILHIIDTLKVGGKEKMCVNLANLFAETHQVGVCILSQNADLIYSLENNIETIILNENRRFYPSNLVRLAKILRKAEIIHVHSRHTLRYIMVCKILFPFSAKIILHDHNFTKKFTIKDQLIPIFLKNFKYVAVSEQLANHAQIKWKKEETHTITNFIQHAKITPKKHIYNSMNLLCIANFLPYKNHNFLLHLMLALKNKAPDAKLTIIGQIHNKEYYLEILRLIDKLKLNNAIRIISQSSNVLPILNQFDLALHASKTETGPLVLLEYLNAQLPFLSIKKGEIAEKIHMDLPQFFLKNYNQEVWLDRIFQLMNDDASEQMKQCFKKNFDPKTIKEKWKTIYLS